MGVDDDFHEEEADMNLDNDYMMQQGEDLDDIMEFDGHVNFDMEGEEESLNQKDSEPTEKAAETEEETTQSEEEKPALAESEKAKEVPKSTEKVAKIETPKEDKIE